jgi:hypothetical protein
MVTRLIGLVLSFVLGSACASTAGPFITHIEAAGPGALRVTKCTVEYTQFFGNQISTGDCSIEMVWLGTPVDQNRRIAPEAPREVR